MRKGHRALTTDEAEIIRKEYEGGSHSKNQYDKTNSTVSMRDLAHKYGVSVYTIELVVYGLYNKDTAERSYGRTVK